MKPYFLVLDQGTSSTKSFLFNRNGKVCHSEKIKHRLSRPKPLFVECDASIIAEAIFTLIRSSVQRVKREKRIITAMGLAVQRSTFLFWDKETLTPKTPALSWQDNRANYLVEKYNEYKQLVYTKTGAPLSGHFGALKYVHLMKEYPSLKKSVHSGDLYFGSLSSYLIHALTGSASIDHSIAGRSQLYSLDSLIWDQKLCNLFNVNSLCLPPLVPTVHSFGKIKIDNYSLPLNCVVGDQQAALIGQEFSLCEQAAINLGTSGSVQLCTGNNSLIIKGLISSLLWSSNYENQFFIEGTINAGNSLFYWLEDYLDIPHRDMKWEERCEKTKSEGVLIPGFTGIASPYWIQQKESLFYNLDGASKDSIIRAGMESIGLLIHDIFFIFKKNNYKIKTVHMGGGGAREPLLQFIADILNVPVIISSEKDKTARGVFRLLFKNHYREFPKSWLSSRKEYFPKMSENNRQKKLGRWNSALVEAGIKNKPR